MANISDMNVLRASYNQAYPVESDWDGMKAILALGRIADTNSPGLIRVESQIVCPVEFGVVTSVMSPEVEYPYNPLPSRDWHRSVRLVGDAMFLPEPYHPPTGRIRYNGSFEFSVIGQEQVTEALARLTNPKLKSELPFRFFRALNTMAARRLRQIQA